MSEEFCVCVFFKNIVRPFLHTYMKTPKSWEPIEIRSQMKANPSPTEDSNTINANVLAIIIECRKTIFP